MASHSETSEKSLYADISIFGSAQDLAKIKNRYEQNFRTLVMDCRKGEQEGWATEEWRWERESRESITFQMIDGSTVKFGDIGTEPTNKDSPHYLSCELSKRVIRRLKNKYIPSTNRLFFWWLKDIEDSEDGQEFVLAIKILCSTENKKVTHEQTIQWLRTFFHIHNPPYE
jgi:hypothetical protein